MDYLWLKALHIAAVLVWIGGLFTVAFIVAAASGESSHEVTAAERGRMAVIEATRRWDRCVSSPALLIVWGAGGTLAMLGSWLAAPWLLIKLGIVALLSALHGILSGTLRRLARPDAPPPQSWLRHAPLVIVGCVIALVVLVVVKPV